MSQRSEVRGRRSEVRGRRLPLYILAGGRSSRFGSDKARARVGERSLIEVVAEELGPVAASITVVADQVDKYGDLGLQTIVDERPGLGPLAGIEGALLDSDAPWILITTCDVLGLQARWVEELMEARTQDAQAVAFRGERWEPLFALYNQSILGLVEEALSRKELAVWKVLDAARTVGMPLPGGWEDVGVINTREALEAWVRGRGSGE